MLGQHALGMKLNSLDRKLTMAQSHDDASAVAVDAVRGDRKLLRQAFFFDDE